MTKLKTLAPRLTCVSQVVVAFAPKTADPFYWSLEWKALRSQCLARDGHTCTMPGCGRMAKVADHIVSRRDGGADTLENLRSLCREHDNRFKEGPTGVRRGMPDR